MYIFFLLDHKFKFVYRRKEVNTINLFCYNTKCALTVQVLHTYRYVDTFVVHTFICALTIIVIRKLCKKKSHDQN